MRTLPRYLAVALLAILLACSAETTRSNFCVTGAETSAGLTNEGYCWLDRGEHARALASFERALQVAPTDAAANFGAGFTDLLRIVNDLYVQLLALSFQPDDSLETFRAWFVDSLLGGGPMGAGRLGVIADRFRAASAEPDFRRNLAGAVVRIGELEVYLARWEADTGDAFIFGGVAELSRAALQVVAAHHLDLPVGEALAQGEPIYSLVKLDLAAVFGDPKYQRFLTLRDDGAAWMLAAKARVIAAIDALIGGMESIPRETDNQSGPDDPVDYADIFSKSFFDFDGKIYIPGIFGPSPTSAILQVLFFDDRQGVIATLNETFPGTPAALPDAFVAILLRLRTALEKGRALQVGGTAVPVSLVFDGPMDLRSILQLADTAQKQGEGSQSSLVALSLLPNRVDGDKLPWEHPELFEPVPSLPALEADRGRGFDGPSAELHAGNGELMAGFTREGRLKNLFFPGTTSFNLIPYLTRVRPPYLEAEPLPYMGASPQNGSFAGLRIDGELSWPMDWLDHRRYNPMTTAARRVLPRYDDDYAPIVQVEYAHPTSGVSISETAFVPRFGESAGDRLNVLVRDFTVRNTSGVARSLRFIYYGAFNITDHDQWMLSPKLWLTWLTSANTLSIAADGTLQWTGPGWAEHPKGPVAALRVTGDGPTAPLGEGVGMLTRDGALGAWADAAAGAFSAAPQAGDGIGNGYIEWDLGVVPSGGSARVTIYVAAGAGQDAAAAQDDAEQQIAQVRARTEAAVQAATRAYWKAWMLAGEVPDEVMTPKEQLIYRRAAMALKLGQSALTGAIPELFDMQPMWFMVWPGNAAWHAAALEAMGHHAEAEAYLDYAAKIQTPDGHWRMAYTVLGQVHGVFEIEYYQTAAIVWFAWVHWKATGNGKWLAGYWPVIERATDFLLSRFAQNGLLYGSPDYVEDVNAFRQSLFTNSIAVTAFEVAAEMAAALGDLERGAMYRRTGEALFARTVDTFWQPDAGVFWEQFDMNGPHGAGGMAVIAWPFHTFDLADPRITSMAEKKVYPETRNQDWLTFRDSHDWTPGLTKNAVFLVNHYNATGNKRSAEVAQEILDGVTRDYNLTLGGFIAERFFGYGVKGSGKPLLWPQSNFVLTQLSKKGESPLPLAPLAYEP